jgi:hypothetical protein
MGLPRSTYYDAPAMKADDREIVAAMTYCESSQMLGTLHSGVLKPPSPDLAPALTVGAFSNDHPPLSAGRTLRTFARGAAHRRLNH